MSKLERLKNISFDELRTRAAQMLHQRAERLGVSSQVREPDDRRFAQLFDRADNTIASPDDLYAAFYANNVQTVDDEIEPLAALTRPQETAAEILKRFDASCAETVKRADRIVDGRFDLLGYENLSFANPAFDKQSVGASVDWHYEPVAGKRIEPNLHWSQIDFLSADVAGDKKITWELNRHGYFLTLARAFLFTNDERYAETFAAHLMSWMDANPPKLGINWASSLEVAFRSISWLWSLRLFKDSPHTTPALVWRAAKFIHLFASHLETYLSTYFSPNTHLTGEALGLYYIGTLLPQFKRAHVWRDTGERILLAELERQVRPDGVYFEQTSYYHRYTTDFYTHYTLLKLWRGESVAPEVGTKLQTLLDHLMFIQKPDGATPRFGDDDGGKLIKLDERASDDFRGTLANGAALFWGEDYKFAAGELGEETVWLMGTRAAQKFDEIESQQPVETSRAFTHGGYFLMRDGWRADSNYMLLDCGEHGSLSNGHAHADALAFELAARGRTIFVDPGTYTYTGALEMRDRFRHSAAHNTLTIDGESSSVPGAAFRWRHVARSRVKQWLANTRFDFFDGTHDGFNRPPANVPEHNRTVLFLKDDYFVVLDRAASDSAHRYDLNFHLAPDAVAQLPDQTQPHIDPQNARRNGDGAKSANDGNDDTAIRVDGFCGGTETINILSGGVNALTLRAFAHRGTRDASWQVMPDFVSPVYGSLRPAETLRLTCHTVSGFEAFTFMLPRETESTAPRLCEIEAHGGRAFEIEHEADAVRDLLLVKTISPEAAVSGESPNVFAETQELKSDAAWTWLRFDRADATKQLDAAKQMNAREVLIINGSNVRLNGEVVFESEDRLDFCCVRYADAELVIETGRRCAFRVKRGAARVVRLNGEIFAVSSPDDAAELLHFDARGMLVINERRTLASVGA